MKPERIDYDALLESLADGVDLDWDAIARAAVTDQDRRRYGNLRLVAKMAELHRTFAGDAGDEALTVTLDRPATPREMWGHLEVGDRLAGGSFGDVFMARDPQLDRDVALKLLRPSARRPLERLLDEGRTLARVRHPNVVTVYGADVREGRAGLWMELVKGRTLSAWLQTHGPMGPGEVRSVGLDLCRALAAVHAAGLVHGDVKAQNVMREDGGRIVLMDFGSGHAQGADSRSGTPLYLAPEVLKGQPATPRSDIYGLGVLLFNLLTGSYPCVADDVENLKAAHAEGGRVYLRDVRPGLPSALVDAIERSLEIDPAKRFSSAGEMERALTASAIPDGTRGFHRPPKLAIAGALALAALLALIVLLPRTSNSLGPGEALAVLPFVDPSIDDAAAAPDHLIAGLTADVIRELQRFDVDVKRAKPAQPVAAAGLGPIGERLGAAALLRGEVRRTGTRINVHVVLARTDGAELWSQDYGSDEPGLPMLAREIAMGVKDAIGAEPRATAPAPSRQTNYRAYTAYLRGRALAETREPKALMRSLEYFNEATRLDPQYAEPWAGKADTYTALGVPAFGPLTPLEARRLAKEAALNALERDPDLAEAHTSLAFMAYFHDWDWAAAETRFKKALELNPSYALAHHWYADYLTAMGRPREAAAEIARAYVLEPLSILIHRDIAWHMFFERRYDDAIAHLEGTLAMDPGYRAARTLLARCLTERGRYTEALEHLRAADSGPSSSVTLSFVAYVQAASGDRAAAEQSLRTLAAARDYVPPYYIALVHAALGDHDRALSTLERAMREQDSTMVNLNVDPRFDRLRGDPRFDTLVARMRFPGSRPVSPIGQ
jgi:serine/threonine-protein kinase